MIITGSQLRDEFAALQARIEELSKATVVGADDCDLLLIQVNAGLISMDARDIRRAMAEARKGLQGKAWGTTTNVVVEHFTD